MTFLSLLIILMCTSNAYGASFRRVTPLRMSRLDASDATRDLVGLYISSLVEIDKAGTISRTITSRSKILSTSKILNKKVVTSSNAVLKLTTDESRFIREKENYKVICNSLFGMSSTRHFVKSFAYDEYDGTYIHLMEAGIMDLKVMSVILGPLRDYDSDVLYIILKQMTKCVEHVHRKGYVWSDVRLPNFVLAPTDVTNDWDEIMTKINKSKSDKKRIIDGIRNGDLVIKGIDLESVTRVGKVQTDFSPEIVTPMQADILANGYELVANAGLRLNLPQDNINLKSRCCEILMN